MLKALYRQTWVQFQTMEAMQHRLRNLGEAGTAANLLSDGFDTTPLRQVLQGKASANRLTLREKRQLLGYFAHTTDKRIGEGQTCEKC